MKVRWKTVGILVLVILSGALILAANIVLLPIR